MSVELKYTSFLDSQYDSLTLKDLYKYINYKCSILKTSSINILIKISNIIYCFIHNNNQYFNINCHLPINDILQSKLSYETMLKI